MCMCMYSPPLSSTVGVLCQEHFIEKVEETQTQENIQEITKNTKPFHYKFTCYITNIDL